MKLLTSRGASLGVSHGVITTHHRGCALRCWWRPPHVPSHRAKICAHGGHSRTTWAAGSAPQWQPRHQRRPQVTARSTSGRAQQGAALRSAGPHTTRLLDPFTIRVGGDDELPITATVRVTVPEGGFTGPAPLVLLSPGFLLQSSLYATYCEALASWGFAVATYDVNEVMDDAGTVAAMQRLLDACGRNPRLRGRVATDSVALLGHSRGAKLSCLLAATPTWGPKVRGLLLLDPVDNTSMTPAGEGYPSALPGLLRVTAPPARLPVLVVGAGSGGDVIPESANYKRFMAASRGPTWCVDLQGAGHLSFLDKQIGLLSLFSASGSTPDVAVRKASKIAVLTWLQHVVFPAPGAACEAAVAAAGAEIKRVVSGASESTPLRLDQLPTAAPASAATTAAGREDIRTKAQAPPLTMTREQLKGLRASQLKAMLAERGIRSDDVFEKEGLVQRLVEKCGVSASSTSAR